MQSLDCEQVSQGNLDDFEKGGRVLEVLGGREMVL